MRKFKGFLIVNWKSRFNSSLLWLLPYLIFTSLLIFVPFLLLISRGLSASFIEQMALIRTRTILVVLIRSVIIGIVTSSVSLIFVLIFVYFLLQIDSRLIRSVIVSLLTSPLVVFTIIKVWSLRGLASQVLIGKTAALNSYWFLTLGSVYLYFPLALIPIYLLIKDMPRGLMEASYDLGFSRPSTFMRVVLPYISKASATAFSIVLLTSATSIVISEKLLPDNRNFTLVSNVIYTLTSSFNVYQFVPLIGLIILTLFVLISLHLLVQLVPSVYLKFRLKRRRKNIWWEKRL